ncbi:hypothetical protein [Micromonospora sp. NPDC050695]|uniref:hypothetical protein n=1 Tax=Micromonospora sp. NPDC050695 TaxID=3154938 RepID=UPI00340CF999
MTDTINATPAQVLATPMQSNDAEAATVGEYLIKLLADVWREQECFNGKRPFGNSGWDYELIEALVRAGLIDGEIDEDGTLMRSDDEAGSRLIAEAIQGMSAAWTEGKR